MRTLIAAIVVCICLAISMRCSASDSPRLFMAQKGKHVAFLLPVLHAPSAKERDSYLPAVIEEVFRRSTILYDESSGIITIYLAATAACPRKVVLSADSQKKLDLMYADIKQHDQFRFPVPQILKETDFIKIMMSFFGPVIPKLHTLPRGFIFHEPQVSSILAAKYRLEHQSIETMEELHTAYCGLDLEEKTRLVDTLAKDSLNEEAGREPSLSRYYDGLRQCAIESLASPRACLDSLRNGQRKEELRWRSEMGHAKFVLFDRNRIWFKKIMSHTKEGGVPFYAFGAEHFLHNAAGPGILTQLQRAGFNIKLVKSMNDVPIHVREISPRSETPPDEDSVCKVL